MRHWLVLVLFLFALGTLLVLACGDEGGLCVENEDCGSGKICVDGVCEEDPCIDLVCDDGNECTTDTCDSADGTCDNTAVEDGTECGDGAGTCEAGSCVGTFSCTEQGIRQAIAVGGGPHTFECDGLTPVVTEAEIVIDNDVILDGEGDLRVDGNDDHRVFSVAKDVTAELRGITVTKGKPPGQAWPEDAGGGIYNYGSLTLTDTTVSGNSAVGGGGIFNDEGPLTLVDSTVSGNTALAGGGIYNYGSLTLTGSTVSGNSAEFSGRWGRGGGIVNGPGTVTLTTSWVSDNAADGGAGGILNDGTMTITDSTVSGNTGDGLGGGIENNGTMTVTDSTVSGNSAGGGGGIYNHSTLELTNVTVAGNSARRIPEQYAGSCGGICNGGTLTITNSTVSGNAADRLGGGISSNGAMTLTNSTVSGNEASEVKGISYNASRYIGEDTWVRITTITNTVVEGDCVVNEGPITFTTSLGYNIESPGDTCGFNQTGDQPGVTEAQLNLGPLTYNGGPTPTHKPGDGDFGVGSFAIDQIPEADCEVTEDQRGEPRPETGGTMCDVGAVEVQ